MLERNSFGAPLLGWAATSAIVLAGAGCAHQTKQAEFAEQKKVRKLKSRIEELERTNGRLLTRLDEMEDDVFLLEDRVQAHRLALRRRGRMGEPKGAQRGQVIRAPRPTPETRYGDRGYRNQVRQPRQRFNDQGRRITTVPSNARGSGRSQYRRRQPNANRRAEAKRDWQGRAGNAGDPRLNDGAGEPQKNAGSSNTEASGDNGDSVVITDEDFKRFARNVEGRQGDSDSGSDSGSSDGSAKRPQKRVTDERLATSEELERKRDASPGAPRSPSTPRGTEQKDNADGYGSKDGLDLYKAALAKYRAGNYAVALSGFRSFMDEDPRNDYRDNGLYWVGECYFGLGKYQRAVDHFQRVLDEQPNGNKVPDAMLKMALAYQELGNSDKMRTLLETLVQRYPSTNAGRLGQKKLSDLKS